MGHTSPGQSGFQKHEPLFLPSPAHLRGSRPAHPTAILPQPPSTFTSPCSSASSHFCFSGSASFQPAPPPTPPPTPAASPFPLLSPDIPTHRPHPWDPSPAGAEGKGRLCWAGRQSPMEEIDIGGWQGVRPGWLLRDPHREVEAHASSEPRHSGLRRLQARAGSSESGTCEGNHRKAKTAYVPHSPA